MSSLMQHNGRIDRRKGIELFFYLVEKDVDWETYNGPNAYNPSPDSTTFTKYTELIPGTSQPVLYRVWRKPCGMFGPWVVFRYNGKKNVPDLSIPIPVFKLPNDAERLTNEETIAYWHS